mgnify:CR=1 FL=1
MRKSLLLFVLLAALSAGLLAGACAAVQGRREAGSYRAEILAGDPAAADGVERKGRKAMRNHAVDPCKRKLVRMNEQRGIFHR